MALDGSALDVVAIKKDFPILEIEVHDGKRLVYLFETLGFDLDEKAGLTTPHVGNRGADAACEADVIVLDQNRVEQAHAVICRAPGTDRVLFERAERRRRFARVEHTNPSAGRVDEAPRACRDARQALKEVERRALAHQERASRSNHFRDLVAGLAAFAVVFSHREGRFACLFGPRDLGSSTRLVFGGLPKRFERDVDSGQHAVGLHQEHPARVLAGRDRCFSRDVASAEVFLERAPHDVAIQAGV